jgi:hypothetical protein
MALFDSSMFDTSNYGGVLGQLLQRLQMPQPVPSTGFPDSTQSYGAGGIQYPVMGQPTGMDLSAREQIAPQAAPQPPPTPPQQLPSALQSPAGGNFGAGIQGLLNAGSPLQGLGNLIGGLATGQRTDPSGMAQQSAQATYQALRQILPEGLAQAAALNPEVLKTIAPQLYSKPTMVETANDPLTGQKSFVWSQPDKMQATPAVVNGEPVSGARSGNIVNPLAPTNAPAGVVPMGSNELKQVRDAVQSGATGDDFIKQLPNRAFADKVKGIANGDLPYPTGFIMKTPYGQMLTDAVNAYKPGVTAQDYGIKQKSQNNFKSGPASNEVKAINTAIYHADKLQGYGDQMGGVDTAPGYINPTLQGIKNNFPKFAPGFQEAKKGWDATSETLATEISKALNGGTPHVADKEHWRAIFSAADGPAQRTAAIQAAMGILEGRTHTLADQYRQGNLGAKEPYEFISPENKPIFDRLQSGKSAPASPAQAAPTAVNAQGQRITLDPKTNQWVPVRK